MKKTPPAGRESGTTGRGEEVRGGEEETREVVTGRVKWEKRGTV